MRIKRKNKSRIQRTRLRNARKKKNLKRGDNTGGGEGGPTWSGSLGSNQCWQDAPPSPSLRHLARAARGAVRACRGAQAGGEGEDRRKEGAREGEGEGEVSGVPLRGRRKTLPPPPLSLGSSAPSWRVTRPLAAARVAAAISAGVAGRAEDTVRRVAPPAQTPSGMRAAGGRGRDRSLLIRAQTRVKG